MATICAVQLLVAALTEATAPVAPAATAVLSHSNCVGRWYVPGVPVTRLVNPDGIVVATGVPVPPEIIDEPNHSSSSLLPATVNPVAVGLAVVPVQFKAPTTSIEHGPARSEEHTSELQ